MGGEETSTSDRVGVQALDHSTGSDEFVSQISSLIWEVFHGVTLGSVVYYSPEAELALSGMLELLPRYA
jgi:hypothetical protein